MSSNKNKSLIKKYYNKIKKMTYNEIYNQLLETDEDTIKYKLLNRRLKYLKNNKQEKIIKLLEKESIQVLDNIFQIIYSKKNNYKTKKIVYDNNNDESKDKIENNNNNNNNFIKPYISDSYNGFASYP